MMSFFKTYPFSLSIAIAIAGLSLLRPPSIGMSTAVGIDKVAHCLMYATLSGAVWWELLRRHRHNPAPRWHCLLIATVGPTAFGGLMELAQAMLTGYRSADWADFVANLIGILAATYWGYRAWRRQSVR